MKVWQWLAVWFCFGVGSKQGWLDVPTVPVWLAPTVLFVVVLVHIGASAFGKKVKEAMMEKKAADGHS